MDDLFKLMRISSAGMKAQGTRLRVISENVANADSLPKVEGEDPYRRKTVTFQNKLDRGLGVDTVHVKLIHQDKAEFEKRFDPSHPAADKDGYVVVSNVNRLIELMDMCEAQRTYEANLLVVKSSKALLQGTIDILR